MTVGTLAAERTLGSRLSFNHIPLTPLNAFGASETVTIGVSAHPKGRTPISGPCNQNAKTAHATKPMTTAETSRITGPVA
jgi:hypothetical protein